MNESGASGPRAEQLCAEFLQREGLRILARNWRCRHGEIDLVALEGQTLVFAEVRLRSDARFGGAAESITAAKQRRILAASRLYLAGRRESAGGRHEVPCRFDVLLLDALDGRRIRWLRNAFHE